MDGLHLGSCIHQATDMQWAKELRREMSCSDEEEVLDFLQSEQDAYYSGDFEAFIDHWHHGPEVRRILAGPQVGTRIHRGWDELLPRFEEGFRQYPQKFDNRAIIRNENVQVQVSGDMAWVSYDQIALDLPTGMHLPPLSHGVKIVQRFNGKWKLICFTDIAPGIGRTDVPRIELAIDGRVVEINDLAKERLANHAGLLVSGDRIRARNRKFGPGLQAAIDGRKKDLATNLPPGFLNNVASVVPLGEDDACHPVFCWVFAEQERILITFDDEFLLHNKLEKAATTFGLSPAQFALAERLATGFDLVSAASDLGVSANTVRTQVRRMFDKTGTHNQTALISLLLSLQGPD
ncbi:MAG: LuxR C-terminal-related transcriptional regulator [Hyphomicrobiales bacterium]